MGDLEGWGVFRAGHRTRLSSPGGTVLLYFAAEASRKKDSKGKWKKTGDYARLGPHDTQKELLRRGAFQEVGDKTCAPFYCYHNGTRGKRGKRVGNYWASLNFRWEWITSEGKGE